MSLYRLVYFTPDPFEGTRFVIGAVVLGNGTVQWAPAWRLPCETCVGGKASRVLLSMGMESMARETLALDELPTVLGPHFSASERKVLPDAWGEPVEWLQRHVLPGRDAR